MDRRVLKNLDFTLLAVVGLLVTIGLVMVYSATRANVTLTGGNPLWFVERQLIAVFVGVVIGFVMLFFDYRVSDRMSQLLYVLNIIILILVLTPLGVVRNGARSWIFGFQPAEFSKIVLVITLGKYLAEKESLASFYDFIGPFLFVGVPLALILLQPDLGTGLVFIFIFLIMLYAADTPPKDGEI